MIDIVDEAAVRQALAGVRDPEIPTVSIVDLGVVERVEVTGEAIRVELLPTFVGCPALDVIRSTVAEGLSVFGRPVEVDFTFAVPWTSDRISRAGRDRLRRAGIAPPTTGQVTCPHCESTSVAMDNLFGPTLCRMLYYCRECRQPFEAFKPI